MKHITFETHNQKDIALLLQLAQRLNIKTVVKDDNDELNDHELTLMGMKLSETSLAKDWEDEDDDYWNGLLEQKSGNFFEHSLL